MVFSLTSCGRGGKVVDMVTNDTGEKTEVSQNSDTAKKAADTNKAGMKTISKEELKIGVLYIGSASETSGYTYAHEIGIQGMANNIGLSDNQPHGGWPVLPSKLDEIISTQEALVSNMTALDTVLSTTPAGGNLETADRSEEHTSELQSH